MSVKKQKNLTFIDLLIHSSATILTSDSKSSHRLKKASMAIPRNLGKSVIAL